MIGAQDDRKTASVRCVVFGFCMRPVAQELVDDGIAVRGAAVQVSGDLDVSLKRILEGTRNLSWGQEVPGSRR